MVTTEVRTRPDRSSDGELVQRIRNGETSAFADLIARHQPRLLAICRSITHDDQDAHDALQNALIAAWQGINGFRDRASVGTWLSRVAINASIDEVRRRGRRPCPTSDLTSHLPSATSDDSVVNHVALLWAMDRLPAPVRKAMLLRDHYGLSYQEIAELHDTTADAVRARLARGRRALTALLDGPRGHRGGTQRGRQL